MSYLDSLDIANRAIQHTGGIQIVSVTEDTKNNFEATFAYDKLRKAELGRAYWRFAIKKAVLRPIDTTTMLVAPSAYDATKTYLPGAIVADTNGLLWISNEPDNINNTPGTTDVWDMYFGPLSVSLYDSSVSYYAGELVYKLGSVAGTYTVYLSLINNNSDVPDTATPWSATTTYGPDAVVSSAGSQWRSLIPVNLNVTPADGPLAFDITATYSTGNTVTGSDHFIYSSVGNGNTGHDPTTDAGVHWTNTNTVNGWSRTPTLPVASTNWRLINCTLKSAAILYPLNTGPSSQTSTNNVFRLPSGYMRSAPQMPKAGSTSALGAPGGLAYTDWEYDGNYIVSASISPIVLRFVADVTKVSAMHDMFCEGLACRIAIAITPPINQSEAKLQSLASQYKLFMGEARAVNAIEEGPTEPPVDDYIACRS